MEKKDLQVGTCLYTVPTREEKSPKISYIEHMDAGIFEKGIMKGLFNVTESCFRRNEWHTEIEAHTEDYDAIIDKDYYLRMVTARWDYDRGFCHAVCPIKDWSYMYYGHMPICEAEWKGEINVGDCFMCFGTGDDLAIVKITRMEYSDPRGVLRRLREIDKKVCHDAKEREWPMEGMRLSLKNADLQHQIYKTSLIHPIEPEIFDKALEAYSEYCAEFDKVTKEIRERYGLPELKKEEA